MKTRRILAASTAALLAFGSVAVVASAASSETKTVSGGGTVNVSSDTTTLVAQFTLTGKNTNADTDDTTKPADANSVKAAGSATITGTTLSESISVTAAAGGTQTAKIAYFEAEADANNTGKYVWKSAPTEISFTISKASAGGSAVAASDLTNVTASVASKKNVKGAISFDAGTGSSYIITGITTAGKDLDGNTDANYSADNIKAALADLTDDDFKSPVVGNVTVSMTAKDAKSLKGRYEVKINTKTVSEDENDKVYFDEDEDIAKLKLSTKNVDILKKTDASKVQLIEVKVGKNGDIVSSIGKNLKVEVNKTWSGAKVYHVNSDGSLTEIKASTTNPVAGGDKKTTFTTSNFSPFIITTATLDAKAASTDDTSSAAASTAASTTNPNTGIALAIAPVVLAAGAVAVVALKKKH